MTSGRDGLGLEPDLADREMETMSELPFCWPGSGVFEERGQGRVRGVSCASAGLYSRGKERLWVTIPIPVMEPAEYFLWRGAGSGRPASCVWNLRAKRGLEGILAAPLLPTGVGGRASPTGEVEPFHRESTELGVWARRISGTLSKLSWDWLRLTGREYENEPVCSRWSERREGEGGTLLDDWMGTLTPRGGLSGVYRRLACS